MVMPYVMAALGVGGLVQDVDVVWKQNLLQFCQNASRQGYEVLLSRDSRSDNEANGGFMYLVPNSKRALGLFELWLGQSAAVLQDGHNQEIFNRQYKQSGGVNSTYVVPELTTNLVSVQGKWIALLPASLLYNGAIQAVDIGIEPPSKEQYANRAGEAMLMFHANDCTTIAWLVYNCISKLFYISLQLANGEGWPG